MSPKINVAVVGLGFGAEFVPIYQAHPDAELVAVCRRDPSGAQEVAERFEVPRFYTDYDALLADPEIDAVHLNTPIPEHAYQSVAALRAGKHVACTVPMATSLEDCRAVVRAAEESGRRYMMMETSVYTREFLHVQELVADGTIGEIQFLRGAHHQEMAGWPGYWEGLPPMHYATHAVGPVLTLAKTRAESVVCFGSGRIGPELSSRYGSPFAVESALLSLSDSVLAAEVARSLFATAREYVESFTVFGDHASFEWEQIAGAGHVLHVGEEPERISVPDFGSRLPPEIAGFTTRGVYGADNSHLSFTQGDGHGGSHPHLVHEFVRSILDDRPPAVDAAAGANWTAVGICAHESALQSGVRISIPDFGSEVGTLAGAGHTQRRPSIRAGLRA